MYLAILIDGYCGAVNVQTFQGFLKMCVINCPVLTILHHSKTGQIRISLTVIAPSQELKYSEKSGRKTETITGLTLFSSSPKLTYSRQTSFVC